MGTSTEWAAANAFKVRSPKLGGQSTVYLTNALNAYKSGQRSHPSMRGIAASLSDEAIADLAAYYAVGHK